jgi:AsmA family protein
VLGVAALTLLVFALAFDWNWLRVPVERHLAERSGQEVRIGDLDVDFHPLLEPTVRLRDVYVQNADWASSKQPLIEAQEVSFAFALSSLWGDNYEVRHLTLRGAKVAMERLADGRRNWRLIRPHDTGPGRVRVMLLEAHDSTLRFANRAIDLELTATATPLAANDADAVAHGLATRIAYRGEYQGHGFAGEAAVPHAFSFRGSGISFPARGHLTSRGTRLDFDGVFTDLFDIGPADAKVALNGPSLEVLYPFVRMQPPPSKPYSVEAQLTAAGEVYRFAHIQGKIGATKLGGDAVYDRSLDRPSLEASLAFGDARAGDLEPLAGVRRDGKRGPFRLDALRAFDARIDARAARLAVESLPPLDDVRVQVRIDDGVLVLKAFELKTAGGRVAGSGSFDARRDTASASLLAEMRGANLQALLPSARERGVAGSVGAKVALSARGASAAEMLSGLAGTVEARLDRGTISELSDAKLAMAFGKVIGVKLRGERELAIGCAHAAFDVRGGVARSRRITFDTEETRVDGTATIDLRNDTLDAVLTPEQKKPGLLTRRASLRMKGELANPVVTVIERVEQQHAPCTP